jgi:hypothetical protein
MKPFLWIAFLIAAQSTAVAQAGFGTIHGRVLQSDGKGVAGVSVELVKSSYGNGQRSLLSTGEPTQTGPQGAYRFQVAPGEYYIRAGTISADQNWRTYFPGTTEPGKAEPIRVTQGAELSADIRLPATPAFKISVRLVDKVPVFGGHHIAAFYLTIRNSSVREVEFVSDGCSCPGKVPSPESTRFVTLAKDRFEIRGVPAGSYDLKAMMWVGDKDPFQLQLYKVGEPIPVSVINSGQTTVEVNGSDVGVTVEIRPGVKVSLVDVKGRMIANGKPVPKDTALVSLNNKAIDASRILEERVDKAGVFTIRSVPEGNYQFSFLLRSPDAYVEDVRQDGKSILDSGLTVGKSPAKSLEVLVNPVGGTIDGLIQNGGTAIIVLIPAAGRDNIRLIKISNASPSGDFKFRGVAPGDYRILAFNDPTLNGHGGGALYSSEFTDRYSSQATPVNVQSGVPVSVRLSSISP